MTTTYPRNAAPSAPAFAVPSGAPALPWADRAGSASVFPRRLSVARWVLLGAVLASAVAWALAAGTVDDATRAVGHDTATSIVAAEKVRTLLADADGQFANALLSVEGEDGPYVSAFRQDLRDASTALVDASRNITFGDEERGPIVTLSRGVAEYEQLVGIARGAASGGGARTVRDADDADNLMRFTLLPAAAALDRVNSAHLAESYRSFSNARTATVALACVLSLVALALLGFAQVVTYRKTRRTLNPGLLGATAVVALLTLACLWEVSAAGHDLAVAKEDAFDSVTALSAAKANASDANAVESLWLLSAGDAPAQSRYAAEFSAKSSRVSFVGNGGPKGLLQRELANVTFPNEAALAHAASAAWDAYVAVDVKIRALEAAGRHAQAVSLDVGSAPGQSNWAYSRFVEALDAVTDLNREEFDAAIGRSEGRVNARLYVAVFAAWLLASASAWFGIRARLREYGH